ncbi:hypothetical protein, partial [Maricaulis sp.]|uniref:hypothetical protein n=1 Tax=Maricaulis sp. TaxID=1486257 RepID=UPI003A8E5074
TAQTGIRRRPAHLPIRGGTQQTSSGEPRGDFGAGLTGWLRAYVAESCFDIYQDLALSLQHQVGPDRAQSG